MSGIRGKDTKPEIAVRKGLHARGFRYRLHDKGVAGKPDLILPRYRAAVFVNGCFWHGHDCHLFKMPTTRPDFWRTKIEGNVERDRKVGALLQDTGWRALIIWECALKGRTRLDFELLMSRVRDWMLSESMRGEIGGANER